MLRVHRVEKKKLRDRCVDRLTVGDNLNAYLYEGIIHDRFTNYCFLVDGEVAGLIHMKTKAYLHLWITDRVHDGSLEDVARFVQEYCAGFRMLFGDRRSVERFIAVFRPPPISVQRFFSMEIRREFFSPRLQFSCRVASSDMVSPLLPLQMAYEVEEVGADSASLDRRLIGSVLRKKIQRQEVSVVFDEGRLVGMAGVNARFRDFCQIGSVYVEPSHRRKGYGSSLVSYHLVKLFARYRRVLLFVKEENEPALRMYANLGFRNRGVLLQAQYPYWS
jgi:ribosomal protein S18 acetylase RimI-like enzyme